MVENPEKFILDVTCGKRMMWRNKQHPNALYLDSRAEVGPDYVADFRDLRFIPDKRFKFIIFDPPHIIQNSTRGNLVRDYGCLSPDTWDSDLKKGFAECWRVLEDGGTLIFKWSELCHKSLEDILKLFSVEPIITQVSRVKTDSRNRKAYTYWCCFIKIVPSINTIKKDG